MPCQGNPTLQYALPNPKGSQAYCVYAQIQYGGGAYLAFFAGHYSMPQCALPGAIPPYSML